MPISPRPAASTPSTWSEGVPGSVNSNLGQLDFGMTGGDHPPKALAPRHFRRAENLVHVSHIGPQRRVRVGGVLEDRLDADELTHVGAIVLDADRLAARPVDDDRGSGGDLHRPDAQFDVVVLIDRVVVVRLVGMESNRLARQHHLQAVGGRSTLGPVCRADPDDRQRNVIAVGDPRAHRFGGDLAEAVVRPQRHAWRIGLTKRAMALVAVDRSGRAEHEALGGPAMMKQRTRIVGIGLDATPPVLGARVHRRVKDVAEIVGQRGEIGIGHVERERCDACCAEPVAVGGVPQPGRTPHLVALGQRTGDGEGDLAGRAGDQHLLSVEHSLVIAHRHPNVKYLICWFVCS